MILQFLHVIDHHSPMYTSQLNKISVQFFCNFQWKLLHHHRLNLPYLIVSLLMGTSASLERKVPPPSSHRWVTSLACSVGRIDALEGKPCPSPKCSKTPQTALHHAPAVDNLYYRDTCSLGTNVTPCLHLVSTIWDSPYTLQ